MVRSALWKDHLGDEYGGSDLEWVDRRRAQWVWF